MLSHWQLLPNRQHDFSHKITQVELQLKLGRKFELLWKTSCYFYLGVFFSRKMKSHLCPTYPRKNLAVRSHYHRENKPNKIIKPKKATIIKKINKIKGKIPTEKCTHCTNKCSNSKLSTKCIKRKYQALKHKSHRLLSHWNRKKKNGSDPKEIKYYSAFILYWISAPIELTVLWVIGTK